MVRLWSVDLVLWCGRYFYIFLFLEVLMLLGECVGLVCYWWILGQMVVGEEGDVEVCVLWGNVL